MGIMWRQAFVAHRMWEILSYHTTRNWLIQASVMRSHAAVEKKEDCLLEGKCKTENIIHKCIVSTSGHPNKVYLGTAEGDFEKRYYNHISSFKNETQMNNPWQYMFANKSRDIT